MSRNRARGPMSAGSCEGSEQHRPSSTAETRTKRTKKDRKGKRSVVNSSKGNHHNFSQLHLHDPGSPASMLIHQQGSTDPQGNAAAASLPQQCWPLNLDKHTHHNQIMAFCTKVTSSHSSPTSHCTRVCLPGVSVTLMSCGDTCVLPMVALTSTLVSQSSMDSGSQPLLSRFSGRSQRWPGAAPFRKFWKGKRCSK